MGERGPAPKPLALIELNGNAGQHPKSRLDSTPQFGNNVEPPAFLAGEALTEWERLAPAMIKQGLLTEADVANFASYCVAWQAFVKAAKELANADSITDVQQGSATPIGEVKKAQETLLKIAKEFGFTPSARTRVVVQQIQGASKLAELEDRLLG